MKASARTPETAAQLSASAHRMREVEWHFCHELTLSTGPKHLPRGLFKSLVDKAESIDCRTCGRCCRQLTPVLTKSDVERLAKRVNMSQGDLIQTYLRKATDFSGYVLKKRPCPFLKGNLCSVYDSRPQTCRSYPHLHKEEILGNPVLSFQNTLICPMVFVIIDGLRTALESKGTNPR